MTQSPLESQSSPPNHAITITIWLATLPALYILLRHLYKLNQSIQLKGCRRLGLSPYQSNLHDEYDPKYTHGLPEDSTDDTGRPAWRVKALFTYPIKSCAGIEFETADAVSTGFVYDRHFCFAENIPPRQQPDCAGNVPVDSENTTSSTPAETYWTARTMRDGHFSRLALIRPEIWVPDPQSADYCPDLDEVKSQGVMIIYYPRVLPHGHETHTTLYTRMRTTILSLAITIGLLPTHHTISIPLAPPKSTPTAPVKIWKDSPLAYDYREYIPQSLRNFLQPTKPNRDTKPLTLFATIPSHTRPIFRNAPRKESLGFQPVTAFADAYPLHLINLASVHDVASRCSIDNLSVRRFRANIIVTGPGCFEEDSWKRIRVYHSSRLLNCDRNGDHDHINDHDVDNDHDDNNNNDKYTEIHTVCRTMRCKLPNVDPATGLRHRAEPDRSLRKYRCIDPGDRTNAALGMQLVPGVREFTLRVDDTIKVLERGEHCYIKMLKPGEVWEGV
ncbi:MOSC domain protein [Aspergillus candidus]|uniref:MOSC domain-containing protein n=1 Tax=Aspergillus candidus TaxID=41067 RepID=A0A2I2FMI6_ASPCN|nr:hypothetical protein BDW47DRAFT_122300 [Aspergillus candidus]PLB41856.1 hypothetical protein BDW47DRAFT_122300 [Aspergillus candidus]